MTSTSTELAAGTRVRVSDNPTTDPSDGYVDQRAAGQVGTVERERSGSNYLVRFDGPPSEQYIAPKHLTPIIDGPAVPDELPESNATLAGRIVVANVGADGSGRATWMYVVVALERDPSGSTLVYGVDLTHGRTLHTDPGTGELAPSWTMARVSSGSVGDTRNLSEITSDMRTALATLFQSPTPAAATPDAGALDRAREEGRQEGRQEQRRDDVSEFEEWKRRATETAHEYADNNDLCSEFDRCMEDIGLPPRSRDYDVTIRVRLSDVDRGDDPWSLDLDELQSYASDVTIVDVDTV